MGGGGAQGGVPEAPPVGYEASAIMHGNEGGIPVAPPVTGDGSVALSLGTAAAAAAAAGAPEAHNLRRSRRAQLAALMKKQAIVKGRGCQACCTCLQLCLPVAFFALMCLPKIFIDEWAFNETVFPTASLEDAASWGYDTCPEGHELLYAPASDGTRVLAAGAFVDMLCKGGGGGDASLDAGGSLNAFWVPIFDSERTGYDFTALRDMAIPSYARGTFYERVAACNYEGAVASGALEKFGITSLSWDLDRDACDACVADLSSCADELHDLGLLRGFEDKAAAEAHIELNPGKTLALAAMEGLGGSDEVKLTLRVNGTSVLDELVDGGRRSGEGFAFGRMFLPRWGSSNPDRGTWRKWFAFANVQAAVERAIIRYLVPAATGVDAPSSLEENITIKGYPYPARDVNMPGLIAGVFLALVLPLAFITNTVVTVKAVVTDKELRIREGMAMMGLYDGVFWTAHFSTEMIVMTITFVLVSAISVYPLSYSNPLIHFIFFELWGIAFVMHCFFLSTFFSKGRVASLACSMFYLFQLAPAISARVSSPNGAASWNSVCILPGAAMYMWGSATAQLESASLGITADTMRNELNTTGPPHSPATILRQVFGSIVMYTFLTFYFDRVLPKTYGTRLPPWFIFLPSYWKSVFKGPRAHTAVKGTTDLLGGTSPKVFTEARNVEPLAHDVRSRVSVRAKGVTKRFGTVLAVDGLDLEFVEGQVSGLLGHNGAGKTTTLNMLTGMLPATEGEGTVAGYDIRTQMGAIRSSLGVCPQFDILWPTVTVLEHLRMYAAFKGVPAKRVDAEARATAARVGLAAQLNYHAGKMSGGQRRKLSLGIAFIGGPKVVLLDEPTTGMDPESRRFCWSMIQSYKADRTIMLTTHFMDEADVLCDRIAIMSQGAVAANGSSVFLKSRFGIGYTLSLSMLRNADSAEADAVVQLVKSHVAGAEVSSRVGTELTMRLPSEATPKFGALLRALEAQSPAGGDSKGAKEVASYGMSCTTLEEVFLRIAEGAARIEDAEGNVVAGAAAPGAEPAATPATARGGADGRSVMGENFGGGSDTATGGALARQQFDALMRKRFINMKRDRLNVCTQIVTPVLCLTAALFMNNITPEDGSVTFSAVEYTRAFAGNKGPLFAAGADASAQAAASVMAHFPLSARDEDDAALPTDAGTRSAASAACFCPSDKQNAGDLYGNFGAGDSGQLICSAVETSLGPSGDYEFRGIAPECANDFATTIDAALIASAGYVDYACNEQDGAYCDAFFFESARVETTADGGATIDADWTLLPNPSALHSVPVGLNSLHNALLGALGSDAHISLINYPLPVPGDPEQLEETEGGLNLATAIFVLIGLSTLSASFGVFLVWERRCNAKHLQVVSGIDQKLFWFAAFAADYLNYLVATVAMLIVCAAVPSRSLDTADGVGAFAVLLLFFGLGALPLSYALHFKFQSEMACLASLIMAFQFFGMGTTIASIVMQAVGESDPSVLDAYDACKWFFRLIPHYCLGRGTYDILQYFVDLRLFETGWMDVRDRINDFLDVELDTKDEVLDLIDVRLEGGGLPSEMEGLLQGWRNTLEDEPVLWTMDRLGWHLIFLLLDGLLFMSAVLLIEYKRTRVDAAIAARLQGGAVEAPPADEDEDVRRERQEIAAGATTLDTALVVDGLSKTYANGVKATRPMHVRMERGQCFGLLGINGAGKTTTFKMLTGEFMPSSGDAYLLPAATAGGAPRRMSVVNEIETVRRHVGYCPQFDGLQPNMTCREHLTFYALARGVPYARVAGVGEHLLQRMGLSKYSDRRAGTLSGGNKRKLSVAIALIGDPDLVLLDEPSSGMDPQARRFMWDVLVGVMPGRCMVLTSHSMEECEALCARLGIMVDGRFRCLGGLQHLKSRFSEGYTLDFRTAGPADTASTQAYMARVLPAAELREAGPTHLRYQYQTGEGGGGLADLFLAVEGGREGAECAFEDYSVGQTTLEQVFLRMAREGAMEAERERNAIAVENARAAMAQHLGTTGVAAVTQPMAVAPGPQDPEQLLLPAVSPTSMPIDPRSQAQPTLPGQATG